MTARRAGVLLLLIACCLPATAAAGPRVGLIAKFSPYKLGASTTVTVGFRLGGSAAAQPLTGIAIALPAGIGLASTTLGLATCDEDTLLKRGPSGCPTNAVMGFGTSIVRADFGTRVLEERARVTPVMAPSSGNETRVLFYAEGLAPIAAGLVFPAKLQDASDGAFGTSLEAMVPPIPIIPDAPDASVVQFQSTLGPARLTYYKNVHGRRVAYRPTGFAIPRVCPREGFPFALALSFGDGTRATARTVMPCPHRRA
jgi:hypothetical protein